MNDPGSPVGAMPPSGHTPSGPGPGGGAPGDPGGAMGPGGAPGAPGAPGGQAGPAERKPARRIGAKPPPDRAPRSIYLFSSKNKFRKKCIEFVEWKPFEFLILLTILGNCVALAVYTPFPAEDTNETNLILVSQNQFLQCQFCDTAI